MTDIKTDIHTEMTPGGTAIAFRVVVPDHMAVTMKAQMDVFARAASIYAQRNELYQDNWRRMGWRGMLIRIRERSERLWDAWWDREGLALDDSDDALDLINFAAFFIRAQRGETNRDGSWW